MDKIMILTGSEYRRIPQIYFNNPSNTRSITLDIMMANLEQANITNIATPTVFDNLYWNSVNTNTVWYGSVSGSTQLEIYNNNNGTELIIPYPNIDTIKIEGKNIIITTDSDKIVLNFLSEFNRKQAYSRINWVLQNSTNRFMNQNSPGLDIYGPMINFIPSGMTQIISTDIVTSYDDIRNYWVSGATDDRDGWMDKSNVSLIIRQQGTVSELSAITSDGYYEILFMVSDMAGNQTTDVRYVIQDSTIPVILLKNGLPIISGWTTMNISADTMVYGSVYASDFRNYLIDSIYDDADGLIPISSAITYVYSGSTYITSGITFDSPVTGVGYYDVTFIATNIVGNTGSTTANLHIIETVTSSNSLHFKYNRRIFIHNEFIYRFNIY